MRFSLFKKSPSSGSLGHLLPEKEKNGPAGTSYSSPSGGEVARRSRVGEGAFKTDTCAIWNDIQRALESK
ncbi:hypothetical protein SAMN05216456_3085 [Devosia crocina]|uniref:Uncharacterized protein n=1 Tax=Devosia crocina TaxID=429728 RepID=A0A1I7NSV7_9HYPH|nr:hypothetical protein SAMN05216456_3085 [Devosia crocina]